MDRHFRQLLAIEFNAGFLQTVNELAITQTTLACSRVDTDDPKLAKLTLSNFAITIRKRFGANQGFLDCAQKSPAPADVPLCAMLRDFL